MDKYNQIRDNRK